MTTAAQHTPVPAARARIHGLDAVRGGALLLGIVLHSLMPISAGMPWMVEDSQRADWPIVLITAIHLFRMTMFMLMAGYFARLMRHRCGTRSYLADRLKRITLPVVVFWPLAVMPLGLLAAWHASRSGTHMIRPDIAGHGGILGAVDLGHLWFLWVLTQVIIIALLVRAAAARLFPVAAERLAQTLARVLTNPGGVLLAAVPYAITTNLQGDASGIVAPSTLLPDPVALIAYLGAFLVGWILTHDPESLTRLGRQAWWHAGVLVVLLGFLALGVLPIDMDSSRPGWSAFMALFGWLTCYTLLGLAVRHLTQERAWIRYLADASYWMYLMHLVLLTFFEVLIAGYTWPLALKVLLNIIVTTAILLATYHLFVRSTALGGWLNGRRARKTDRVAAAPGAKSVALKDGTLSSRVESGALEEANKILPSLVQALEKDPIICDKVRFGVIDFSDDARVALPLCDLLEQTSLPARGPRQDELPGGVRPAPHRDRAERQPAQGRRVRRAPARGVLPQRRRAHRRRRHVEVGVRQPDPVRQGQRAGQPDVPEHHPVRSAGL